MDRDISLDAIKLVACIFVCTLHTIGMFMPESSDFHLSYLLFYMSGIAVPLFFMVNGFLLAPKDGGMKYYYRKIFNIVKIVCVFTFIFDIPKSDYPFMHLLYSQLLVCQRVCLQNTVCLICK